MWLQLGGMFVSLFAGAGVKALSKKKGSTMHELLTPVAAVIGGAAAAAATGDASSVGEALNLGLQYGASAWIGHAGYKQARGKRT